MRRSLGTRVVALEQRATLTSTPEPLPMWLLILVALELGDLQEHEAVVTGYGRALGYDDDVRSFRAGLASDEVGERHQAAVLRMVGDDAGVVIGNLVQRHERAPHEPPLS